MPIYEYECRSCGSVQEIMQKLSDPAPSTCLACQQGPLVKLVSRTAFILKGEGWYVTDFRDKGKKPTNPKRDGNDPSKGDGVVGDVGASPPTTEAANASKPSEKASEKAEAPTDKTTKTASSGDGARRTSGSGD